MNRLFILFILIFLNLELKSQSIEVQSLVNQGIELSTKGEFEKSIEIYKNALAIDPTSDLANYQLATSFFALLQYENAIIHCDNVIKAKAFHVDEAYILKGSSLQMLGKPNETIKMYQQALKDYPSNYVFYYNLGSTYYRIQKYKEAEKALIQALAIHPDHANSNLLLGFMMKDQQKKIQSILALYNFLLLESCSERTINAFQELKTMMKGNITEDKDHKITIYLDPSKKDDFGNAELMISMLAASKNLEENKFKKESEFFAENTSSLFSILGELKKKLHDFWWNYYVDFFYEMQTKNHVEAFSYFIQQCTNNEEVDEWINNHKSSIQQMLNWAENYDRKH